MKITKKSFAIVLVAMLLTACASGGTSTINAPAPRRVIDTNDLAGSTVERLVIYAERIRWFAPSVLEAERTAVERDIKNEPSVFNRLRLALLLTLRRAPFRDEARARDLFSQAAKERGPENQATRSFAMLWLQELDERWSVDRMLDDERRQRMTLQKKLDQLKAIEEEMGRRTSPPVVAPR